MGAYNKFTSEASTASLPDVAKVYAKMSSEAYKDPDERAHMIGGFEYKREYSNQLVGVYYLQDKNLFVIAIKGKKVQICTIHVVSFNSIYCKETYTLHCRLKCLGGLIFGCKPSLS